MGMGAILLHLWLNVLQGNQSRNIGMFLASTHGSRILPNTFESPLQQRTYFRTIGYGFQFPFERVIERKTCQDDLSTERWKFGEMGWSIGSHRTRSGEVYVAPGRGSPSIFDLLTPASGRPSRWNRDVLYYEELSLPPPSFAPHSW